MTFRPGQSGNPRGRPKVTLADGRSLSDLAKEHTETALTALISVLKDKRASASARVQAATALLDRGWGRPHQAVAPSSSRLSLADELQAAKQRELDRIFSGEDAETITAFQ